jgi:hypothetical protein
MGERLCGIEDVLGFKEANYSDRGCSVLPYGYFRREHAALIWRGRESFHPTSTRNYKQSDDESIFAWSLDWSRGIAGNYKFLNFLWEFSKSSGLLANSSAEFVCFGAVQQKVFLEHHPSIRLSVHWSLQPIFAWLSPNDLPFAEVKPRSEGVFAFNLAIYAVLLPKACCAKGPRSACNRQSHPFNMQQARMELLPRSHDLPPSNRPRQPAHL